MATTSTTASSAPFQVPAITPARLAELQLCLAAEAGQLDEVQRHVAAGVSIECRNERRYTPLLLSVANVGAVAVTAYLISAGADVNAAVEDLKLTPLHIGCKDNNEEGVRLLMAAGADVMARDCLNRTVLHYAALGSSVKVMHKLLQRTKGALINAADEAGYTPLMVACEHGRLAVTQLLLDRGADARLRNKLNHHAVELADWFGAKKVVEELDNWVRRMGLGRDSTALFDTAALASPPSTAAATTPVPGIMSPVVLGGAGGGGGGGAGDVVMSGRGESGGAPGTANGGNQDPIGKALTGASPVVPFGTVPTGST